MSLFKTETTESVMAEFRKTYDRLRAVEQNFTHKVEQEEIVIEEALRRRREASEEAVKAALAAEKINTLINPHEQPKTVISGNGVGIVTISQAA